MYLERILYPIETLGRGKRIAIWMQGCWHKCQHCINPELWVQHKENMVPVDIVLTSVCNIKNERVVDGITITGGDPFYQIDELIHLLQGVKKMNLETLVYTGFVKSEIEKMWRGKEALAYIDVLIDGPYVEEGNINNLTLRGSENQMIYFRTKEIEESYKEYLLQGRKLQNFFLDDGMISVGIHDKKGKNENGNYSQMAKRD